MVCADEPVLIKAVGVLQMVAEAHRSGRPINESKVFSWINSDVNQRQRIFHALSGLRLIGIDVHGEWLLGRDLQAVSVWQPYQLLPDDLTEAKLATVKEFPRLIEMLNVARRSNAQELSASLKEVV